jgi:hypothetical protein
VRGIGDYARIEFEVGERRLEAMATAGVYMARRELSVCSALFARMSTSTGCESAPSFTITTFIPRPILTLQNIMIVSPPFELHALRHSLIIHMLSGLWCRDRNIAAASHVRLLRYLKHDIPVHGLRPTPPTIRMSALLFGAAELKM